jgi:hypothetical protein
MGVEANPAGLRTSNARTMSAEEGREKEDVVITNPMTSRIVASF